MGFFLRKSFSAGPVRFNLSKSGLGVSTGVKGLRIGAGPRGPYVAGAAKGVYYRSSLGSSSGTGMSSHASSRGNITSTPTANLGPSRSDSTIDVVSAPRPRGTLGPSVQIFIGGSIVLIAVLTLSSVPGFSLFGIAVGLVCAGRGLVVKKNRDKAIKTYFRYDALIDRVSDVFDASLLSEIQEIKTALPDLAKWKERHRYIYARTLRAALKDGISQAELAWLKTLSDTFEVDSAAIHVDAVRPLFWEAMADGEVSPEEQKLLTEISAILGVPKEKFSNEWAALNEFIRGQEALDRGLPVAQAPINLQKNEICHHVTKGAFLESKVLRSYVSAGERIKEEGLVTSKEGDIYITSKRLLIVGDGTSSIPHEKVLEVEIDADQHMITLTKDGRQKPIYLKADDAIYCGILLEHLSK
jgi:tellurite resistance protein